eukprot:CAMPEP_0172491950 /NCGR_PEP_ID=MMETSP1066-20121228/22886_1 /TAXON_ID=671091 /ORGANISM="Coscinodiscus wailesii, Strain CCMP2513" /LENGTH=42 /DNA_ID= /DNA_START= /DNA_END= /DNA_ORIENTATION=
MALTRKRSEDAIAAIQNKADLNITRMKEEMDISLNQSHGMMT